jgi:opacity protein-like surface antigen
MKKAFGIAAVLLICIGSASAAGVIIEGKVGYFSPTDSDFKSIYGGGMIYGGEARLGIWNNIMLWAEGKYFKKTGKLTFTQEETTLSLTGGAAGLMYALPVATGAHVYIGAGADYVSFSEKNIIGNVTKTGVGLAAKVGVFITLVKHLVLDGYYEYSTVKMTPADFKIDVGGHEVGAAIGVRF